VKHGYRFDPKSKKMLPPEIAKGKGLRLLTRANENTL
jgi:hypothetical protein